MFLLSEKDFPNGMRKAFPILNNANLAARQRESAKEPAGGLVPASFDDSAGWDLTTVLQFRVKCPPAGILGRLRRLFQDCFRRQEVSGEVETFAQAPAGTPLSAIRPILEKQLESCF
jgi:hypothetical protein